MRCWTRSCSACCSLIARGDPTRNIVGFPKDLGKSWSSGSSATLRPTTNPAAPRCNYEHDSHEFTEGSIRWVKHKTSPSTSAIWLARGWPASRSSSRPRSRAAYAPGTPAACPACLPDTTAARRVYSEAPASTRRRDCSGPASRQRDLAGSPGPILGG